MSYTFIIVTANTCGHCLSFKEKYYKVLLKKLENYKDLNIIHIEFPTMKVDDYFSNPGSINKISKTVQGVGNVNPIIVKYIRWFPLFMLVNTETWKNSKSLNNGFVFNGTITSKGDVERTSGGLAPNAENLETWIQNIISKDLVTKSEAVAVATAVPTKRPEGIFAPSTFRMKISPTE